MSLSEGRPEVKGCCTVPANKGSELGKPWLKGETNGGANDLELNYRKIMKITERSAYHLISWVPISCSQREILGHWLDVESLPLPVELPTNLVSFPEFLLVFLPWMKYLEMTELLTSNRKYLGGKNGRKKRLLEKMEHKINTVSGELAYDWISVWHNNSLFQTLQVELDCPQVPPGLTRDQWLPAPCTGTLPHAHTCAIGSCARPQPPRSSSNIFFQSFSLLLDMTLCIHVENVQHHKDTKLFKFCSGFLKEENFKPWIFMGRANFSLGA